MNEARMTPISSPEKLDVPSPASMKFHELLQKLPLEGHEQEAFSRSEVLNVQVHPERCLVVVSLLMPVKTSAESFVHLASCLKEQLLGVTRVVLDVHYAPSLVSVEEYLQLHQDDLVYRLAEEAEISENWFDHCQPELQGSALSLAVPHDLAREQLEKKMCHRALEELIRCRCHAQLKVTFRVDQAILPELPPEPEVQAAPKKKEPEGPVVVYGRNVAAEPVAMKTITEEQKDFVVMGQIVSY
jgi:hypothetical protein